MLEQVKDGHATEGVMHLAKAQLRSLGDLLRGNDFEIKDRPAGGRRYHDNRKRRYIAGHITHVPNPF